MSDKVPSSVDNTIDPKDLVVDSSNYSDWAVSTESRNFSAIADRLKDAKNHSFLLDTLCSFIELDEHADAAKKSIFYGSSKKPIPEYIQTSLELSPEQIARLTEEDTIRAMHCILGIMTEWGGEIAKCFVEYIVDGKPIDWINMMEEGADGQWYGGGIFMDLIKKNTGMTFDDVLRSNILKLAFVRFKKKGFTEEAAINRDLEAERAVLEGSKG